MWKVNFPFLHSLFNLPSRLEFRCGGFIKVRRKNKLRITFPRTGVAYFARSH